MGFNRGRIFSGSLKKDESKWFRFREQCFVGRGRTERRVRNRKIADFLFTQNESLLFRSRFFLRGGDGARGRDLFRSV
jgi:hypothetical protein